MMYRSCRSVQLSISSFGGGGAYEAVLRLGRRGRALSPSSVPPVNPRVVSIGVKVS